MTSYDHAGAGGTVYAHVPTVPQQSEPAAQLHSTCQLATNQMQPEPVLTAAAALLALGGAAASTLQLCRQPKLIPIRQAHPPQGPLAALLEPSPIMPSCRSLSYSIPVQQASRMPLQAINEHRVLAARQPHAGFSEMGHQSCSRKQNREAPEHRQVAAVPVKSARLLKTHKLPMKAVRCKGAEAIACLHMNEA